ncbi:MAG: FecR domain-containing protein [Gammaproteobacteria bacterium]|nr:FecR domain-containing protein [Gammaproteobacteria bacterium]
MTLLLSRWHLLHIAAFLSLIVLMGLSPPLSAQQEPAGRVTVVLGTVEAESADGDRRRLGRGDPVFEGDTLHSGPRGRAQIRFSDRGMVSLRPDSTLAVDSYEDDTASPAANRHEMSLSRGGFRAQTGRIAQANREGYRVQTPVAVIGIRGTVFDAHQHPGGPLLVGSTQGGVEVVTSTGVVGRVGAGENFNFLRVNPDGSIDYLLEVPDEFTVSPDIDEGDEDEALDAGDASQASVTTGAGASESTAGIDTGSGDQLVDTTNDPDTTGIVSPSQAGSGEPPFIPSPPDEPVLDSGQIEMLLADDRIGVALGVPSVTVGDDGELQVGSPALQGGIATFNSPLLALSSARSGFGTGLAATARGDLLSEADLLLLPDSAESESSEDVGGVPGLVWGRYLAPVALFVDPSDRSRVLELQRDILFLLGTPADIAVLEGQHEFAISAFDAVSSGLPVTDIFASGLLDVGQARYVGLLDILLGEDSAAGASLLAEFGADVSGGVLEDIEFGTLNLFNLADESSEAAEGELAGFFTGEEAAFLQLAFDFRVPGRDDADVAGLALLERIIRTPLLAPEQESALLGDTAVALATGIAASETDMSSLLAGGIGTLDNGAPILALGANAVPGGERSAVLEASIAFLLDDSGDVALEQDIGGVDGLTWGRFTAPVTQFLDLEDRDRQLTLDRDLLFVLGTPTDIAVLQGEHSFTITDFDAVSSGMPVTDIFASGLLDVGQARYMGLVDILFGEDSAGASLLAEFGADVSGGVLAGVEFDTLDFIDPSDESIVSAEGELGGFFTGEEVDFLQLAFDFRVPGRDDADVAGLLLLARDLTMDVLTSDQETALLADDGYALALGVEPGGFGAAQAGAGVLAQGIATVVEGDPILVLDTLAADLAGVDRADVLAGSDALFTADSGEFTLDEDVEGSGVAWGSFTAPVTQFLDSADAEAALQVDRDILFALGTPFDIADREGAVSYELAAATGSSSGLPILEFDAGAALNFDTAVLFGFLDVQFGEESVQAEIVTDFTSSVTAGVLTDLEILFLEFIDFGSGETSEVAADIAGFLAGDAGEFLQLAFDFRVAGRDDADVSGLALLIEVEDIFGGGLSPEEFFELQEGFFFVAVNCCFEDGGLPTSTLAGRATDALATGGVTTLLAYSVEADGSPVSVTDARFESVIPELVARREEADVTFFSADGDTGLAAFEWQGFESPARAFDAIEGDAVRDFEQNLLVLTGRPTRVADLVGFARYESVELIQGFAFGGGEPISMPFADMSFNVDFADGSVTDGVFLAPLDIFGDLEGQEVDPGPDNGGSVFFGPILEAFFTGQVTLDGERAFVDFEVFDGGVPGEGTDPLDLERSFIDGFFTGDDAEHFAAAFHLETTGFGSDAERILAVGNIALARQDLSLTEAESALFAESDLAFVGVACCGLEQSSFRGGVTEFGEDAVLGVGGDGFGDGMFPALLRQVDAFAIMLASDGDEGGQTSETAIWLGDGGSALRVDAETGNILERLSTTLLYHVAMPLDLASLDATFTTFWGDPDAFSSSATQFGLDGSGQQFGRGFSASFNVDLDTGDIFAGHLFVVEERVVDGSDLSELGFEVFFDGFVAVEGDTPFAALNILDGSYRQRTPLDLDNSSLDGFFAQGVEQIFFAGSYDLRGDGEGAAAGIFEISNIDMPETRLARGDVESWVRFGPGDAPRPGFGIAVFRHGPDFGRRAPGDGFLLGRASDPSTDAPFVLGANALMREATGEHAFVGSDSRDFFGQPFDFILRQGDAMASQEAFDVRPSDDAPTFAGFEVSWGAWASDGSGQVQDQAEDSSSIQLVDSVFFASVNPTPTSQLPVQGLWSYDSSVAGTAFFGAGGASSLQTMDPIESLSVGFMVDFGSGAISDGALQVTYGDGSVQWDAQFDGFLNGAVTEFEVTSLELMRDGSPVGFDSTPDATMAGMLTGPDGQRHVGGFNLAGFIEGGSGSFESVHGIWVIDGAPQ